MPPTTTPTPPPISRGTDAHDWLAEHGFLPKTPAIRSSDENITLNGPFHYYLIRRLGIVPAFSYSEALSRGSWFHTRHELLDLPGAEREASFLSRLDARSAEIRSIGSAFSLPASFVDEALAREEKDALTASAWFDAALDCYVHLGAKSVTLATYLSSFQTLGVELELSYKHPHYPGTPLVVRLDRLIYDPKSNAVYILDLKTCSEDPSNRLQLCTVEFQTWLYLYVVSQLLDSGALRAKYPILPADVRFGGMLHVAFQKPTITFGANDRDSISVEHTLKSGPRKGLTEVQRVYQGEPKLVNYLGRVRDWYARSGEFSHLRSTHPDPVNISTTSARLLDSILPELHTKLSILHDLATANPHPDEYPRCSAGMKGFHALSPYAPFYVCPFTAWPEIMQTGRFIISHRDTQESSC